MTGPISLGERLDVLFAALMAHLTNINKSKGQTAAKMEDYLVKWDRDAKREMDPLTMRRNFYGAVNRKTK